MPVNGVLGTEVKDTAILGDQEWDHLGSTGEICQAPREVKRASMDRTGSLSQQVGINRGRNILVVLTKD